MFVRARELRKQRGLSQQQVAERLNVKQPVVSKLEGGKVRWRVDHLAALAELYGCRLDELVEFGDK